MREQKDTPKEQGIVSPETHSSSTNSRRSFLTKVAVAAPLLTTIASRPVWAGECTLSGNLSNNVSNHDETTHCSMWGYSGGAWCEGHADNNDFWSLIGLTKDTLLVTLLTSYTDTDTDPVSDTARIGDALKCQNYSYQKLNKPKNEKGLWKQRAVAALNLLLWEVMIADVESNNCLNSDYGMVHADFYFFTTLSIIMSADISILENANRDGFTGSFQTTC